MKLFIIGPDFVSQVIALDLGLREHRIEYLTECRHASRHSQVNDFDTWRNRHACVTDHEQIFVTQRRNAARKLRMKHATFFHHNLSPSLLFVFLFVDMVIIHHGVK